PYTTFFRSVRRRRIDHDGARIRHECHRFPRRIVGQAEEGHIRRIQAFRPRRGILAARGVDPDLLELRTPRETLVQLEPRGALRPVDEDLDAHGPDRFPRSGDPRKLILPAAYVGELPAD